MDTKALRQGLRDLRNSIEDFLDNLEMDGEAAPPKKEKKLPDDVKSADADKKEK